MPCNNVVELIQIKLDENERLTDYEFVKKSCGQGVGNNSLMIDVFRSLSISELLELEPEAMLSIDPTEDRILEFLRLKHLFAVKATLEVFTGAAAGAQGHACAVADVAYDGIESIINAEIDVDIITEQIKSCPGCKGCGVRA